MNIKSKVLETTIDRLNELSDDDDSDEILSEPTGENSKDTLGELIIAICVWGVICQITVVWFLSNKLSYSLGLWLGCIAAIFLVHNMWKSLDLALDMDEKNAKAYITNRSILRYALIVILLGICMAFLYDFAHPLAVFLGIMTMKAAAYTQPFIHGLVNRFKKEG